MQNLSIFLNGLKIITMIYSKFAEIYNELMDDSLYADWREYVLSNVTQKGSLLEVAGGTGDLAILLQEAGYDVTLTDLSYEMLEVAVKKLTAAKKTMDIAQVNMMDLSDLDNFDVITCFDDSICYLKDENETLQAFKEAASHLNDKGTYLFDAHSIYQMDEKFPGYMFNFKNEDSAFMWSSYEGEFEHSVEHDLTFFSWNEKKDGYDVDEELHEERTYSIETYIRLLKEAGFNNVEVTANFGREEVKDDSIRWFFKCKK